MDFNKLIECWQCEVSNKKKVGRRASLFFNVIKRIRKNNKLRFLFLFRFAQFLNSKGTLSRRCARRIQQKINLKYSVDIDIGARIEPGLRIAHLPGIVISRHAQIGRNFFIRQNCTIGVKSMGLDNYDVVIGDNVSLGANSCIIADRIQIGSNVNIGAMTFVNRDIPSNHTFFNRRKFELRPISQDPDVAAYEAESNK